MKHVCIYFIAGVQPSEAREIVERVTQASSLVTHRKRDAPSAFVIPKSPIAPPANSPVADLSSGTSPVLYSEYVTGPLPSD